MTETDEARLAEVEAQIAELLAAERYEPLGDHISRIYPEEPPPRHLMPLVDVFERARRGGRVRAGMSLPPGHGKTTTIIRGLGWWPTTCPADQNGYASMSNPAAWDGSRLVRKHVEKCGVGLADDANAVALWRTLVGGGLAAYGVGGFQGKRVHGIFVIDDPYPNRKAAESPAYRKFESDWFKDTATNRVIADASILVVHTRWHDNDMIGRLARQGYEIINLPAIAEDGDLLGRPAVWEECLDIHEVLNDLRMNDAPPEVVQARLLELCRPLPRDAALWPEQYPIEELVKRLSEMQEWSFTCVFQGRPGPRKGRMFQEEWFPFVSAVPSGGKAARGWDLAGTKGDDEDDQDEKQTPWTVGVRVTLVGGVLYIEGEARKQGDPGDVVELLKVTARADGYGVKQSLPQDPGQAGKWQKTFNAAQLGGYDVHFSPESGPKEVRARPVAAQAKAGNVRIVKTGDPKKDAWIEPFLREICAFPTGRLKDRVDALSRAYAAVLEVTDDDQPVGGELRRYE